MDHLRSPWRHAYVTSGDKPKGCVMCTALAIPESPDGLVVHVGDLCFILMNLYPYSSGHVMVAPKRHVGRLTAATTEELQEMMALTRRLESVLGEIYKPDGMNLGMNLGRSAGAGVADHIHLHMVPRWVGDSNFMSVVAETRVIPEDPVEACRRLRVFFER